MTAEQTLAPLIRKWDGLSPLDSRDREAIFALPFTLRAVERDSYLVREGQVPRYCSLILSGFAFRHKLVRSGARQILSFHVPGEIVDLQNSVLSIADHNVQALGRAEVADIPRDALSALASSWPRIARAMWIDTLIDASIFREWVVNVGRRDSKTRIAHLLCELWLRLEAAGLAQNRSCELPLSQTQIADATGLTAVHVNRVLRSLRESGLIELASRSLTILDWDGLCRIGDFRPLYLHQSAPSG